MNRYLEHDGMKRGLKSQDCAKVLKAVQGYIPDNWHTCFQEVKGALQAADYIALAEKHAPYTKAPRGFVYEHLDRYFNEWFAITREKWLSLYVENNRRVCSSNTYGPTLRIKYPCGYVGFKGIPAETKADKAPEPIKPEQLDSKACRQFVEQLLAFDELEKNRVLDIDRLLVSLLSSNQIGLLSYVLFLKGYTK